MGDFFSGADGRMGCTSLKSIFGSKENLSFIFNLETMMCGAWRLSTGSWRRSGGQISSKVLGEESSSSSQTKLFSLHFRWKRSTTVLLYILRLEFGSLKALVELFMKVTERWAIPAGSVIIVASATQLASSSLHGGPVWHYRKSLVQL